MRYHTTPSPRTGWMIFMNVASQFIITGESLSTHFLLSWTVSAHISFHRQRRRRRWRQRWPNAKYQMHRCELKMINVMWSMLAGSFSGVGIFYSWNSCSSHGCSVLHPTFKFDLRCLDRSSPRRGRCSSKVQTGHLQNLPVHLPSQSAWADLRILLTGKRLKNIHFYHFGTDHCCPVMSFAK